MAGQDEDLVDVDPYPPSEPETTIPVFKRLCAPSGYATKRQLRAMRLRPGGREPVAEVETRGPKNGLLYEIAKARPVRPMTLAKAYALDKAMAARQTRGTGRRRYFFVLPTSLKSCLECHDGTPADPSSYIAPPAPNGTRAGCLTSERTTHS
ncbi:RRQRL motif-containing zinc-binding protein [Streptomyces sp. NPDC002209]|uniref:RRQRL motif-containing zinc-binding protein n=1 Tax=Streptomyces sp. NPDC002209 TaxID=3364638 RepID=UPI0036B25B2B